MSDISDAELLKTLNGDAPAASQGGGYSHLSDDDILSSVNAPGGSAITPSPATPTTPQYDGAWRDPAILGSGVAKGAVRGVLGPLDLMAANNEQEMTVLKNVWHWISGHGEREPMKTNFGVGITEAGEAPLKKAGIIDNPALQPSGFLEKSLDYGGQGLGGALPYAAGGGGFAMNLARGTSAGLGAGAGHEIAPDSKIAPVIGALVAGGAPDVARLGTSLTRNALGAYDPGQRAAQIMAKDLATDKVDPSAAEATMAANPDKPLTIADMGGTAVQRRMRTALDTPGEKSAQATQMLQDRDLGVGQRGPFDLFKSGGAADRVIADTKKALGGDDAFKTAEDLVAQRKTQADPLYEAFRQNPPIDTNELKPFMRAPAFRSAVARANASKLNELGEPLTDLIAFNEAGDPVRIANGAIPPDTLDRIKQGVDDTWLAAKASGDAGAARTANILRDRYVGFLDSKYPNSYAAARLAYSGPSASLSALQQGAEIFNTAPQAVKQTLSTLAPEDRDLFRIGVQQALVAKVKSTSDGANEVRGILGSPAKRESVAAAFQNPQALDALANGLGLENRMFATKANTLGNSNTAPRLMDQAENGLTMEEVGHSAAHAAGGNWPGAAMKLIQPTINRLFQGANRETMGELAHLGLNPDLSQNQAKLALIRALMNQPAQQSAPFAMIPPVAGVATGQITGR